MARACHAPRAPDNRPTRQAGFAGSAGFFARFVERLSACRSATTRSLGTLASALFPCAVGREVAGLVGIGATALRA
jgi:hypothetical protein